MNKLSLTSEKDKFESNKMVLATNGHQGDSSDEDRERENVIHIGSAYQAVCPELISSTEPCPDIVPDKAILVWHPESEISDSSLDDYICLAKQKYGYNAEQAFGMLYWHGYDMDKAIHDLPNFIPFPDEWTVEDKVLFEQAFQFHGKNFAKIRQMLPDKTIPSLVKHYYSWKKSKNRISLMDKQARRMRSDDANPTNSDEPASGNVTENESDSETTGGNESQSGSTQESTNPGAASAKETCSNCGSLAAGSGNLHPSPKGPLCTSCSSHWKRTGMLLKTGASSKLLVGLGGGGNGILTGADLKKNKKPPKGMYLKFEDLMGIASGPPGQGESILKGLDSELCSLKRQVQLNKAEISRLKEDSVTGIENFRPSEMTGAGKINARWSNEEMLLAVQGVRKYGRDFKAISEVIGNKSESHIRTFYANYRDRYNLDEVLSEWERDNGISPTTIEKPEHERDVPTLPASNSGNGNTVIDSSTANTTSSSAAASSGDGSTTKTSSEQTPAGGNNTSKIGEEVPAPGSIIPTTTGKNAAGNTAKSSIAAKSSNPSSPATGILSTTKTAKTT